MDDNRGPTSTALGLCLLPSELLYEIFCRLALPEVLRLKSVSKALGSLVAADEFRRLYDQRSGPGGGWVFVFKKRPPRDSVLRGFNARSGRWFQIPVAGILAPPAVPPGEDLYFLAASGDFFLFASNGRRELVAVNIATRAVWRIPASPLGPRGTSSWRRSGLKLVSDSSGSDGFRFLFAEMDQNRPFLFEYSSETDAWHSQEARSAAGEPARVEREGRICLSAVHFGSESVLLSAGRRGDGPVVFRPRFPGGLKPITGDRLHVYGDGNVAVIRSTAIDEAARIRSRVVTGVELWGMSLEGREWELVSSVAEELIEGIKKPYGVMMGCLVERDGVVRLVLMSNCKGSWDMVWLSYDRFEKEWTWVPVPDCGTKGLNMAGIAFSTSFSRLWPSPVHYRPPI